MRRVVGWLFLLFALGIAALGIVAVAARFHDGPLGPIPGGPFQGAVAEAARLDPAAIAREDTIEIEVGQSEPLTRTTWVVVKDGVAFIPAGGAAYKRWPKQAEAEGRMRVRVAGQVFPVQATRVTDPALLKTLRKDVAEKYDLKGDEDGAMAQSTWFFRLDPPARQGSAAGASGARSEAKPSGGGCLGAKPRVPLRIEQEVLPLLAPGGLVRLAERVEIGRRGVGVVHPLA
jgi:hypothetical protein